MQTQKERGYLISILKGQKSSFIYILITRFFLFKLFEYMDFD